MAGTLNINDTKTELVNFDGIVGGRIAKPNTYRKFTFSPIIVKSKILIQTNTNIIDGFTNGYQMSKPVIVNSSPKSYFAEDYTNTNVDFTINGVFPSPRMIANEPDSFTVRPDGLYTTGPSATAIVNIVVNSTPFWS